MNDPREGHDCLIDKKSIQGLVTQVNYVDICLNSLESTFIDSIFSAKDQVAQKCHGGQKVFKGFKIFSAS